MHWIWYILAILGASALAGLCYLIKKFVRVELAEVTPVKQLMVVQHFNSKQFAQLVDMSLLERNGFAKLDQYFSDEPFTEEEMISAGFTKQYFNLEEDEIVYWRIINNTDLILMHDHNGSYWLWGKEEEDG